MRTVGLKLKKSRTPKINPPKDDKTLKEDEKTKGEKVEDKE